MFSLINRNKNIFSDESAELLSKNLHQMHSIAFDTVEVTGWRITDIIWLNRIQYCKRMQPICTSGQTAADRQLINMCGSVSEWRQLLAEVEKFTRVFKIKKIYQQQQKLNDCYPISLVR